MFCAVTFHFHVKLFSVGWESIMTAYRLLTSGDGMFKCSSLEERIAHRYLSFQNQHFGEQRSVFTVTVIHGRIIHAVTPE